MVEKMTRNEISKESFLILLENTRHSVVILGALHEILTVINGSQEWKDAVAGEFESSRTYLEILTDAAKDMKGADSEQNETGDTEEKNGEQIETVHRVRREWSRKY